MEFPFWQGVNQKQYILDRLLSTAALVSINHPARLEGYTVDDMRYLSGYQLLEVINDHEAGDRFWDAALSAGHRVWGIAGDDVHDLTDRCRVGVACTMINSDSSRPNDIIEALRAGRSYLGSRHGLTGTEARRHYHAVYRRCWFRRRDASESAADLGNFQSPSSPGPYRPAPVRCTRRVLTPTADPANRTTRACRSTNR